MLVDVALPGWAPMANVNLNEDIPGSIAALAASSTFTILESIRLDNGVGSQIHP